MSLRESALFRFGCDLLMFLPHNYDHKRATPSRLVGGAGPFDFSDAVSKAAVTAFIKLDNGTVQDFVIDLDDVGITITAVTAAQLVAAITAGLAAHSPAITGFTASVEAVTGYAKFVSASGTYLQVWGEAFELSGFGQGYGVRFFSSNEIESFGPSPTLKEDTTTTYTNAKGLDTEVIESGYKKGFTGTVVDGPEDYEIMALMEGGHVDSAGVYHDPTPTESKLKPTFEIWVLRRNYSSGENLDSNLESYELVKFYNCKGNLGAENFGAGFDKKNYAITGVNYTSEASVEMGTSERGPLTLAAYNANPLEELGDRAIPA